jgi:glucose-1-phosphate cytidylyltransferase
MQVVILCGGQGSRIRDVVDDIPKPMIPIGNRPILWHIMKGYADQGFDEFILCLGHKSSVIKRYFLDYHLAEADFTLDLNEPGQLQVHAHPAQENWRITLAETGIDAMTGCRIKRIEKYIRGDSFLLTYGDGVADIDLAELIRFHHQHGKLGTVTAVHPPGRFGEIEMDGTQVVEFMEKPLLARGRINGGYFVFDRAIFDRLTDDPWLVFENEPLTRLADDGQLMAYRHNGFWHPMDNSRDFKYLNDLWSSGKAAWNAGSPQRCQTAA